MVSASYTNAAGDTAALDDKNSNKSDKKRNGAQKRGPPKKSLLEIHFETVINLLRLRVNSVEKSLFLLIVLTAFMSVTQLSNYLNVVKGIYPNISQSSTSYSIMDSIQYLNVAKILNFMSSFGNIIVIFLSIYMIFLLLLFITCFVDKYMNPNSKPRKYFFGRWFVNMASYFIQILSFPFAIIFLAFIACTDGVISESSLGSCDLSSDNSLRQATFSFSLIGIIISIVTEIWMQCFFYNSKFYKKDATSIEKDPWFLMEISGYRMMLALFTTIADTSSTGYYLAFLILQTVYILYLYYRINFSLAAFSFANPNVRDANQHSIIFMLAESLAFSTDAVARAASVFTNSDERFLGFMVAFWFALEMITPKLREIHTRYVLFNYTMSKKMSPNMLFMKVALFQQLNSQTANGNIYYDSLFKGLAIEHIGHACLHPSVNKEVCFCKCKMLYDPKKRKDTPLDKIFQAQNNSVFTKFIMKSWFETYLSILRSSNAYSQASSTAECVTIIAYSEFLYFKMKNVSLALKNLAQIGNKPLSTINTFKLFRVQQLILKHNRKRNHDAYRLNQSDKDHRNKLEIESVIPVEEQISQIQQGIKYIIKNNIRFWQHLEKASVNLNEINNIARYSMGQLEVLKQLWKECIYYIDYRKKWRFYYCWYYLYILNRKIKTAMLARFHGASNVNENEVFSEELLQDNINDVASVSSNMKVDEMERIQVKKVELAFDKKSVVFHVNSEHRGKILKVNRAVYHGTGYTSAELTNLYISVLMPRIYQNIHPVLMENFALTGKTKTLYSQRKIYCVNKQGHLFPSWKFVKQYVTLDGKCEYVAMLRPIAPPAGIKISFVVMNEDWEIDSMSDSIYEGLGINALDYQSSTSKVLLSLLVLSPKLLRFTKLSRFLTEQDYRQFMNRDLIERAKAVAQQNAVTAAAIANNGFAGLASRFNINKIRKSQDREALSTSLMSDPEIPESKQLGGNSNAGGISKVFKSFNSMQNFNNAAPVSMPHPHTSNLILLNNTPDLINSASITPGGSPNNSGYPMPSINEPKFNDPNKAEIYRQSIDSIQSDDENRQQRPRKLSGFSATDAVPPGPPSRLNTLQIGKEQNEEGSSLMPGQPPSMARRNSASEMMEQLKMGMNNQFLQPNFIRDEILKKKEQAGKKNNSQNYSALDYEDQEDENGEEQVINASDYEDESSLRQGQEEEEEIAESAFQKMDNLEKGDQINFRIRVPMDMSRLLSDYHAKIAEVIHNRQMRSNYEQALTSNVRTVKTMTNAQKENTKAETMTFKTAVVPSSDSRDKQTYHVIKSMIMEYQRRKPFKEFSATCSASFKKNGKTKVIILKFVKFEEIVKKSRTIVKQPNGATTNNTIPVANNLPTPFNKETLKLPSFDDLKRNTITSGLELLPVMQQNYPDRFNRNISIRSEMSDARDRDSVHTNTFLPFNNRFGNMNPANNNNSDTEDIIYANGNNNMNDQQNANPHNAKDPDMLKISKLNGMGYQMKMETDRQDVGMVSERSVKTFHKDFINRQGARNINLSKSMNIMIKEDNHKPNRSIKTIENMKNFVRLFFLLLVAINTFTFFYGPYNRFPQLLQQSDKVFQSKNVMLSALQAYNLILDQVLTNLNMYDDALALDTMWDGTNFQTLITEQYNSECSYFYEISSDSNFKQTFFDKSLMPYEDFEKDMLETTTTDMPQEEYELDTYDLFSTVVFSLKDVQNMDETTITIDLQSVQFFRENIFPSFYNGFSTLQNNLLATLKDTGNTEYNFLIIIILVQSVLILGSFIVLFRLILLICNAFKAVIESFPKISQRDLRKIKNYNINMNTDFTYITEKDDMLSGCYSFLANEKTNAGNSKIYNGTKKGNVNNNLNGSQTARNMSEHEGTEKAKKQMADFDLEEPNDGSENVGKKSKDIDEGGFLQSLRLRIVVLFLVFIIFAIVFIAIFLFLTLQSITNLQLILDSGEVFMNTFSDNITLMIAVKEKTLDRTNYDSTFLPAIQSVIDAYLLKNMQPYMQSLSFMSFDDVFEQIYYGNPCTYLSDLIISSDSTVSECSSLAEGSLSKGVASFNSFYKNAVINFVDNGIDSDTLSLTTVFDYNRGIFYVDLFQVYLVQIWSSNTSSYLNGQLTLIIGMVIIIFIALCIVQIIVTERLLIGRFNKEYEYFSMVYNMYMPEIIIIHEKRIKFYLVKHHIINK